MKCKSCLFFGKDTRFKEKPIEATGYCEYWNTYLAEKNGKFHICDNVSVYENSCDNCAVYEDKIEVKIVSKSW